MTDPVWEPHTVSTREHIDPSPVAALAALFDDGLAAPAPGDVLPPLWHWVALPRWAPSSELDVDGHPVRGSLLPPVDLPRRMFAGGSVEFRAPLRVGDTTRRDTRVESVVEKAGRSGRLVVVTVATTLHTPAGEPAIVETQNLIYREAAAPSTESSAAVGAALIGPAGPPLHPRDDGDWDFHTDPTLLMRFSAATANAHRIHYDWPYATEVEGYPGLVVHGPLMSLALVQAHRRSGDDRVVATLTHRNRAPLFCGQPARVCTQDTEAGRSLTLLGPDGEDAGPRTGIELVFVAADSAWP